MKNALCFLLFVALLSFSCNSSINKIFGKRTPHESYADKIESHPLGRQWIEASKTALIAPYNIQLPYRLGGYFHTDKPRALALQFTAKQGERISFELLKRAGLNFILYADLFKIQGTEFSHLLAADTTNAVFSFDADETATYILRLQPELNRTGPYTLSAKVTSSLGFPVAGDKARPGSFWGDARDGGHRSHEGIDIFAPKSTPAVASADGYISRVSEGGIGGKTVWLRTNDKNISLYYAHLDQQFVQEGQSVKRGDTLGLVGNTGNAKYTPPHLHFGIYTNSGPVDPLPFVNKTVKLAPAVAAQELTAYLKLKRPLKSKTGMLLSDTSLFVPLANTDEGYLVEHPHGSIIQVPFKAVTPVKSETQRGVLVKENNVSRSPGG